MKRSKEEIGDVGGLDFLLMKKCVVEHICWQVWNLKMLLLLDIVAVTPILKCCYKWLSHCSQVKGFGSVRADN